MAGIASTDIHTTLTDAQGHPHTATPRGRYLAVPSLPALGIVYGDIGASPLYAKRECFHGPHTIASTPENVYGVISLICWSLILIISVKYCVFVLRTDNRGEGGILALAALATPIKVVSKREKWLLVVLGIFGAALLYGDGIITPAISVLGAVEGLNVATPLFAPYVVPVTVVIIMGLFLIQSGGTAKVGRLFGPVMLAWFLVIAALCVSQIVRHPSVVGAFNPAHAFARNLKLYAREAGVGHVHLHQTRHTFGRIVAEETGSMAATQDALDHANLSTTTVYVQRIAVKRDLHSGAVARRRKRRESS